MRTIEFRGIIKNPDELFSGFVYGDLINYANGNVAIRQQETGQEFDVVPETVGQFTGLLDKNGKEIFECDIIEEGVVYFDDFYLGFFIKGDFVEGEHEPLFDIPLPKIIGNIFDNPETLKN